MIFFSQFGDIFGGHNPFESFFGGGGRTSGGRTVNRGLPTFVSK